MKELDRDSRSLCELQGKIFENSAHEYGTSSAVFVRRYMNSDFAAKMDREGFLDRPIEISEVPNVTMNQEMIEDLSLGGYTRFIEFKVAPDTDIARLQLIVNDVLSENPLANNGGKAEVIVDGFGAYGYEISFPLSADDMNDYVRAKNEVIPVLYDRLKEKGIKVI